LSNAESFCVPRRPRVSSGGGAERTIRRADLASMRTNGPSMTPEERVVGPDPQGMANHLT
jgi:hypothetical protein